MVNKNNQSENIGFKLIQFLKKKLYSTTTHFYTLIFILYILNIL